MTLLIRHVVVVVRVNPGSFSSLSLSYGIAADVKELLFHEIPFNCVCCVLVAQTDSPG